MATRPAKRRRSGAKGQLALGTRLDTTQAAPLKAALLAKRGAAVAIDASAVQHLGAQCAQVLLSARRTWACDGHRFAIVASSEAFDDGLRLLGLADDLRDACA